jgi:hypothetical protein
MTSRRGSRKLRRNGDEGCRNGTRDPGRSTVDVFRTRSVKGKGCSAEAWYDCMTLSIKALPVAQMAAHDSLLLLWTTRTHVEQALGVIAAWNYVYKTIAFT